MCKLVLSLLAVLMAGQVVLASENVKIYQEKVANGYHVFADNDEYSPVSIKIDLKLNNLRSRNGNNKVLVIPERSKKVLITTLTVIKKNKKFGFDFDWRAAVGDHFLRTYDNGFKYSLPFEKGQVYTVGQGYDGEFSHQGQSAIDFRMPVGTNVTAARAGVVTKIVSGHKKGCKKERCRQY